MELGALGGARFKEQPSFPSERQSLSLTAEGLLRELVQEHRDPAFEYRSLQGFRRCGKWVGGATPIKDNKTKYQFSTLAHWCAQASLEETGRIAEALVSSHHAVFFKGASLHAHEAGLNEAWDSDDSEYCAYLSTSLCAPASGAPTAAASEDARDAGSIMSSGGADKEDMRFEAFASASESESGASTESAAIVQDMLSINRERYMQPMLHRTQTPPTGRLALNSVSRLKARTMPACPTTALTWEEPTQEQKKLVAGSGSVVAGSGSIVKRGCRKCVACHKYHHWNSKCNGVQVGQSRILDAPAVSSAFLRAFGGADMQAFGGADMQAFGGADLQGPSAARAHDMQGPSGASVHQVSVYSCRFCRRAFKSQHAVNVHQSRNKGCRSCKSVLEGITSIQGMTSKCKSALEAFTSCGGAPSARPKAALPRGESKRRVLLKDFGTFPPSRETASRMFVSCRAVSKDQVIDDVSDEVAAQGSCSIAPGPAPAIANQIGRETLEMKNSGANSSSSLLVARCSQPPHTCALCQREFKSQHAVDIHLSRNIVCRRQRAAALGSQATHEPKCLLPEFKRGRKWCTNKAWTHRSQKKNSVSRTTSDNDMHDRAVAQGRLLTGVVSRLAEQKKRQGKDEGWNNKAASSPIFATARSDARCALCSRRFISKHALRIHLIRNANCRRKHESASGKSCIGHRADMEKHQFASLSGSRVLPAPAGFPTPLPILPFLPTLPVSVPVMTWGGFQQQSEMKREVHAGGTNWSEKRSHLKRQHKVPTKLQGHNHHHRHQFQGKEREPDAGGENKIYKKGLFERRLKQLIEFKEQHGHLSVSTDKTSCFYVRALGGWVNAQRRARKRGELPQHMIHALDTVGFPWKLQHVQQLKVPYEKDFGCRNSPFLCLNLKRAHAANYVFGVACEDSNASASSTRIAPSLDAYEFGRGPTGGAYHLSAQTGVGAAATGGSFGKRPAGALDDLLDIDYGRSCESDLMNSDEMDEDESLDEKEKQPDDEGAEPEKVAERDGCEDMGGGDHDEITHLADPLDFLQDTAEPCSIFWGEEAV